MEYNNTKNITVPTACLLTVEQKDSLVGNWYAPDLLFNPVQDIHDNWVILVEEKNECVNPEFMWVKDLIYVIYEPKS